MGIISTPWLPKKPVKTVLVSHTAKLAAKTLENRGMQVIYAGSSKKLPVAVSSHPDMLFLHVSCEKCVVIDKSMPFVSVLEDIGFSVFEAENEYFPCYPKDIGLNCLIFNNQIIGKTENIDSAVLRELKQFDFIKVNQGYTKCSICVVDSNSLITEDESIYKVLKDRYDVLKIDGGCVQLDGYNYGFFGGCTGLVDKNLIAINGELKYHTSCDIIRGFLKERNIDILELKAGKLTDIGSIVPLEE